MFGLTEKLDSLESKIDSGFHRIETRLDMLENRIERKLDETTKHLVGKLDNLANTFEKKLTNRVESLRQTWDSGFARCSMQSALNERIARLELDIERLKAATRS